MAFDSSLPHVLPWNYPWIKDEIERRDEYIAQLEAELAHQKPQDGAHGAIEYESVKVPSDDESGAHSEIDSREKLEAEIEAYLMDNLCLDSFPCDLVSRWLDRQAAITENECRWRVEQVERHSANQRIELNRFHNLVNEHGIVWEDESLDLRSVRELCKENDALKRRIEELEHQRTVMAKKLMQAERDKERYRAALGKAIDCADEIRRLS